MKKMENKILLFLKGVLMGICDLIPGISGGTIAFITGIYERLISAVKSFSLETFRKKDFGRLDLGFLIVLLLGIFSAIFLGSRIIKFLLDNYFSYTLCFFIGLILVSCFIIFENIKNHNWKNILFGVLGFFVGVLFCLLAPVSVVPSLWYVFIGGFFAISAMFLPGISGAFILLIMGLYEFMINVLHNISSNLNYFIMFVLGAGLGAFVISRIISFVFKKDKCKTLYFLLGLVIGALGIPLKKIYEISSELKVLDMGIMSILFLVGILLVIVIRKYEKNMLRGWDDIRKDK